MHILQTHLQKEDDQNQMELCAKLEKLEVLEKQCWTLISTQKTAEVRKYYGIIQTDLEHVFGSLYLMRPFSKWT